MMMQKKKIKNKKALGKFEIDFSFSILLRFELRNCKNFSTKPFTT